MLALVLMSLFVISYILDEPLRRSMERKINGHMKGYSVRIPKLHLQLVGGSLTLKELTIVQEAHPDPPVAFLPVLHAGVNWRGILVGKLVAEFDLDRPEIHVNLQQLRQEAASKVPLKEQGWQQAVEALYPLKINVLTVRDGAVTYSDRDPERPFKLTRLNLDASNIRNVRLPDKVYPSSFHLETAIFGTGRGVLDGKANFLGEPYLGVKARLKLEKVPLDNFKTVISQVNLSLSDGLFSASGEIEYAPKVKVARLDDVTVEGMTVDYIHTAETAAAERERAAKVAEAAEKAGKAEMQLRMDRLRLIRCTVGLVNRAADHPYRVFLSDADLGLTNLSNHPSRGVAEAELQGKFMGSGPTRVTARFRHDRTGPDLDLNVKIENTRMKEMNDLFRAYGNFDVTAGTFFLYAEIHVRNDAVSGYVKPLFKGMKVYDRRKDREKSAFHKMYELLVGGVAGLLENRQRNEVATKTRISGTWEHPHVSIVQIIGELIKNAFFKAILPGFERETSGPGGR